MTAPAPAEVKLRRLLKRSQFLNAARGTRAGRRSVSLQAVAAPDTIPGVGITVTKKVGNSPERNRIKRRLRAAARACAERFQPQHDYVLVGRREALSEPFDRLVAELQSLIDRAGSQKAGANRPNPGPRTE
jgi:ribonuclease P protein component